MNKNTYVRTDLAAEAENAATDGARIREYQKGAVSVHEMVLNEQTAKRLGLSRGTYLTLGVGKIWFFGKTELDEITETVSDTLLSLCKNESGEIPNSVLIVCLGNRKITSDAIGPLAADGITVTRHLEKEKPELYKAFGSRSVSLLSPGVTGETGIEAFESIRSAVRTVEAELVVCVDALAARSSERLMTSLQITDAGIAPGSGVGNSRKEITRATLGVPVVSVGVPTVVQSSTMVYDVLARAGINEPASSVKKILDNERSFFVTPKNSDIAVASQAKMISNAINLAFLGFTEI